MKEDKCKGNLGQKLITNKHAYIGKLVTVQG